MWAHIRGLPPDSAYMRAVSKGWDTKTELLAQTVEGIGHLGYITARLKGQDVQPLPRMRRPNDPAPELISIEDIAAFLKE